MELNQLKLKELKQLAKVWNVQPTGDKRYKKTWVAALQAKREELGQVKEEAKPSKLTALQALESLKEEYSNYIPLFAYRALVPHLSREQQDEELYKLERNDTIRLSNLVEARNYNATQIEQGIQQRSGCPVFFATIK